MKSEFSIIVPVYNAEKFLGDSINSVLNQSYQDFELILVNDGSKDSSGAICDAYSQSDARIKVIHKENQGALSARVTAINCAIGEYFIFLDSDDTLVNNALEIIFEKFQETKADCIIYPFNIVQDGRIISKSCDARTYGLMNDKRDIYKLIFNDQSFNSMCCKAVKASVVVTAGYKEFYNIAHGEDLLQSLEILRRVNTVYFLENALYNYRMNPASATHTWDFHKFKVDFTVHELVLKFLREENYFTEIDYKQYRNYCIECFANVIVRIARFNTTFKNKMSLYKQIRETEYYKTFLCLGFDKKARKITKRTKLIYALFKNNSYKAICFIVSVFDKIKKRK